MSTLSVSTAAELNAALKLAQAEDVILLEAGTYSGVSLDKLVVSGNVTITSNDPNNPAVLTNLKVSSSEGFTFHKLELANPTKAEVYGFLVNGAKNITFSEVHVHGSMNGDAQDDISGISILNSSGIKILNSEFQQLGRGVGVGNSQNIEISGNSFHDLQTDGVIVADVQGVKILANQFMNFSPVAGDHPDAIQFMTKGTTESSSDILISGNMIARGTGAGIQGIFMGEETGNLPYKNVTISDNLLIGTGYNGISVGRGENVKIIDNELISYIGKTNVNWISVGNTDGLVFGGNSAVQWGFKNVTNLVEFNNSTNTATTDEGLAAATAWWVRDLVPSPAQPSQEYAIEPHGGVAFSLPILGEGWSLF